MCLNSSAYIADLYAPGRSVLMHIRCVGEGSFVRRISVSRIIWLVIAIALGAQLGACANLTDQPRDEVRVRIGTGPVQSHRVDPFASLYVPYAMMSSLAYTERQNLTADHCPEPALLDRDKDAQAIAWIRSLNGRKWHCLFGLSERLPCPRRYLDCNTIGVPDVQVWRRNNSFCSEIVIVFRGINLMDPGDWSRLRWLVPRFDHYEQIQAYLERIAAKTGCHRGTKLIAVGHSLGGGLAEEAAHANGRIRYVYAFNSFPVWGFAGPEARRRNAIGLGIDNVYEAGEIVAIPRLLLKQPDTSCNPRVRTVQFNLIPVGLPIEKHRIDTLTMNLVEFSRRGVSARSAMAYRDAVRCAEARL